jgi:succinate dehydrogenase / fumarate reductase cytochrome b subunit
MSTQKRPLSPHLQIYSKQITSVMSILHRLTGVFLAFGSLVMLAVLVSLAQGPDAFAITQMCLSSMIGRLFVFAYSLCLMYHLFNGLRHLFWDAGKGFAITAVYRSGYTVMALTVFSTLGIWYLACQGAGV